MIAFRSRSYILLLLAVSSLMYLCSETTVCAALAQEDLRTVASYDYSSIDNHVLNTPPEAEDSLEKLAVYLAKPAHNDREKARAIFRWITSKVSYDVDAFFSGAATISGASAEVAFKNRKAVCGGYARLFQELAQRAGMECEVVSGYAKGYGSSVNQPGNEINHAWNAVKITGRWYLVDSTWGAGCISGRSFVKKFEDFYFLPAPESFILSHFPIESRWQFLEKPLSKAVFDRQNQPTPLFFNLNLDWEALSSKENELMVKDKLTITLKSRIPVLYRAEVRSDGKEVPFSTFVDSAGEDSVISASLPQQGTYEFNIFAHASEAAEGQYLRLLSYVIHAEGSTPGVPNGFPLAYEEYYRTSASLFSPRQGNLAPDSVNSFKIRIRGAAKVAVIMGHDFYYLTNIGDDVFEGDVQVGSKDSYVAYSKGLSDNYVCILKYRGQQGANGAVTSSLDSTEKKNKNTGGYRPFTLRVTPSLKPLTRYVVVVPGITAMSRFLGGGAIEAMPVGASERLIATMRV